MNKISLKSEINIRSKNLTKNVWFFILLFIIIINSYIGSQTQKVKGCLKKNLEKLYEFGLKYSLKTFDFFYCICLYFVRDEKG
jgi:hypothetical protein